MKVQTYQGRITILLVIAIIVGILVGVFVDRQFQNTFAFNGTPTQTNQLNTSLIQEAYNILNKEYVDRQALNSTNMTYGAISGMVDSLGDTGHTRFMSPAMVKEENNQINGQFEGIGVQVEEKDGNLTVVAPIDNTPAQKAGIKAGDVIQKVNGEDIQGQPINQVISKILGPAGTQVTITVFRPSTNETKDYTLTRARITINNVTWAFVPGTKIAHIRIAAFSTGVTKDLQNAIDQAKSQGATAIVLDLRNNPGGSLDEAVGVTSQFLDQGLVLKEKDAQGKITDVPVKQGGAAINIPMDVLVNEGSASAAEITAGALQDQNRAQLVGTTTFGTGTVLEQFNLSDGSALLVAIQEWLTPNGRVIWHQGIKPNVEVKLDPNATPLTPESEKGLTPAQFQSSQDTQLQKAVQLLQGK